MVSLAFTIKNRAAVPVLRHRAELASDIRLLRVIDVIDAIGFRAGRKPASQLQLMAPIAPDLLHDCREELAMEHLRNHASSCS